MQAPATHGRARGFILLPVALLLALVASIAFLGNRETALGTATATGTDAQDKARYAAEAGLQRLTMKLHEKGCSGGYPTFLYSPIQDTAFDGASYKTGASIFSTSGSPVKVFALGSYGDASVLLTRTDLPMHKTSSTTLALQPAAEGLDTYLDAASPSSNANKTTLLAMPGSSVPILQFDLSSLPAGAHVTSATLSTWAESGSGSGTVALHRITRAWTEVGANWTRANSSTAWSRAGGDVHDTALASATFSGAGTWLNWDITALADRWLKGNLPNQGVQLRAASGVSNLALTSSDSPTASQRPKLVITFLPTCD
jgi:hypothetical protein